MAAVALNLLQIIGAKTGAGQTASSDTTLNGSDFAALLSQASATSGDTATTSPAQVTPSDPAVATLATTVDQLRAQVTAALGTLPSDTDLSQTITPDTASTLLANFDTVKADLSKTGLSDDTIAQFHQALQSISDTGTSSSVADILTQIDYSALTNPLPVSSVEVSDLPPTPPPSSSSAPQASLPVAILAATAAIAASSAGATTPAVATTFAATNTISLSRPAPSKDSAATTPDQQTADDADKKAAEDAATASANTIVQVTPLSQNLLLAAAAATQTQATPQTTNTARTSDSSIPAESAAITAVAVNDNAPASDINTRIPALDKPKQSLPTVALPSTKIGSTGASANDTAAPTAAAPSAPVTATTIGAQTGGGSTPFSHDQQPAEEDKKSLSVGATTATTPATAMPTTGAVTAPQAVTATTAIPAVPIKEQVVVAIRKASSEGLDHITIQLDPNGLGRVEVHMTVARDGQANLSFMVDKPETFDALSRDARSLERSLQDSGIKADTGSMQFNLRQQPQPQHQSDLNDQRNARQASALPLPAETTVATTPTTTPTRYYRVDVQEGVDIHA